MTTGTWRLVIGDDGIMAVDVTEESGDRVNLYVARSTIDGKYRLVGSSPTSAAAVIGDIVERMLRNGADVHEIVAPGRATVNERVIAETRRCAGMCDETAAVLDAALPKNEDEDRMRVTIALALRLEGQRIRASVHSGGAK